jgi:membrane-associated phospholipid phosphatase
MAAEPRDPGAESIATPIAAGGRLRSGVLGVLGLHDLILIAYMLIVCALLETVGKGPTPVVRDILGNLALLVGAAFLARAVPEVPRAVRVNVYRVVLVASIVYSYLVLRDVLPAIRSDAVDDRLAAIDLRLFGMQPVLWLERLNRRPIIEWLSFYYFGYYTVAACYAIGVVWLAPGERVKSEFGIGTTLLFSIGHLLYMAVPAYGPVQYFEGRFHGPIDGGFFWGLVWNSVHSAGALKDVFPSLHTAAPTWFSLFAVTQARRDRRWILPAVATCFFAVNIVISTMVLRWHYVIDVLAGLTLASTVAVLAPRLAALDAAVRERRKIAPAWRFE